MGWLTILVQVQREILKRGSGMFTQDHSARGRRRVIEDSGVEVDCMGFFVEVLRYRRRLSYIDRRIVDKVDKVECRCILVL